MKKITGRVMSFLCASAMIFSGSLNTAFAEETDEKILLPSGYSADLVESQLREITAFASAAVSVFRGNEVIFEEYYGETDREEHIKADENSVYEWGSISKTFVWVSVMQLWEQGKINLERDVRDYLPDGFFQHLSYDEPITMLNLMNHNAGWQESTWELFSRSEDVPPLKEALQNLEPAQINPPGKVTAYSNYGAAVAGYIVECVSGMDYCDYVHKNILEPLGMEHTSVSPSHNDNAFVYENIKKTRAYKFLIGQMMPAFKKPFYVTVYPAGAMTGTLHDLTVFAQALADDSAPLFQDPKTQKYMLEGTKFYGKSDIPECAHGFFFEEHSVRTFGHSGGTPAGMANMLIDPESKTGMVVMVNESGGNDFFIKLPELVFGNLSPDKYSSENMKKVDLSGYMTASRSVHKGLMKINSLLSSDSLKDINAYVTEDDTVILISDDGKNAVVIGYIRDDNGDIRYLQPSAEIIPYKYYSLKLFMVMVYFLMAVFSVFMLMLMMKKRKYGKLQKQRGLFITISGYAAKILSVLLLLTAYTVFSLNYGLDHTTGTVTGILQIVCIAVCCIEVIYRFIWACSEKTSFGKIKDLSSAIGNIAVVAVILMFDMYRFWGI